MSLFSRTPRTLLSILAPLSFVAILTTLLPLAPALAQTIQGSIIGTVKDTTGAVVPGATITLTNTGEGTTRTLTSGRLGRFCLQRQQVRRVHPLCHSRWLRTMDGRQRESFRTAAASRRPRSPPPAACSRRSRSPPTQSLRLTPMTPPSAEPTTQPTSSTCRSTPAPPATAPARLGIVGTLPGVQADHNQFSLQGALPFQTQGRRRRHPPSSPPPATRPSPTPSLPRNRSPRSAPTAS